eukprot:759462-Hanusia_phi.AAC.6
MEESTCGAKGLGRGRGRGVGEGRYGEREEVVGRWESSKSMSRISTACSDCQTLLFQNRSGGVAVIMDIKRASKSGRELWLIRVPVDLPTEALGYLTWGNSDLNIELREVGGDGIVECDGKRFLASISPADETEASQVCSLPCSHREVLLVMLLTDFSAAARRERKQQIGSCKTVPTTGLTGGCLAAVLIGLPVQLNLVEHIPGADAPSECPPLPPPVAQRTSLPGRVIPSGHGFKGLPDSYASGGHGASPKKAKKGAKSPDSKRKVKEEQEEEK